MKFDRKFKQVVNRSFQASRKERVRKLVKSHRQLTERQRGARAEQLALLEHNP